ncbi:MAG: D-tyrosyl-tRNA(Tyr) deacylase [Eubacterium sp.]|nr:D-tyrosyl-tRNA(Tyr) deacylase [Eubacterium sp.]
MKAVIQRVTEAKVTVDGIVTGEIQTGYLILLGVAREDSEDDIRKLVRKIVGLRIFPDAQGKSNLSLTDVGGGLLVISQFTLLADCKKGRRPSFVKAGDPVQAQKLYERFLEICRDQVDVVEHGEFGAEMKVSLVNDGPFTIVLDSKDLS